MWIKYSILYNMCFRTQNYNTLHTCSFSLFDWIHKIYFPIFLFFLLSLRIENGSGFTITAGFSKTTEWFTKPSRRAGFWRWWRTWPFATRQFLVKIITDSTELWSNHFTSHFVFRAEAGHDCWINRIFLYCYDDCWCEDLFCFWSLLLKKISFYTFLPVTWCHLSMLKQNKTIALYVL
jgi:hypothetical protein